MKVYGHVTYQWRTWGYTGHECQGGCQTPKMWRCQYRAGPVGQMTNPSPSFCCSLCLKPHWCWLDPCFYCCEPQLHHRKSRCPCPSISFWDCILSKNKISPKVRKKKAWATAICPAWSLDEAKEFFRLGFKGAMGKDFCSHCISLAPAVVLRPSNAVHLIQSWFVQLGRKTWDVKRGNQLMFSVGYPCDVTC